jgi:ABC-type lipoprotein release transport system permease subunit
VYRIFLALRYLRSRLVNLISVFGVMAGVAVLIVVTSVMDGFQVKVREVLRGNLSDVILMPTT